tara:strand:+ start:247 stop:444 length:198 start_codon:yes stop_codon:yes gene_type:complete
MAPCESPIFLIAMLTGSDLLSRVNKLGDIANTDIALTDIATACGYVSKKKDVFDRVNFTVSMRLF